MVKKKLTACFSFLFICLYCCFANATKPELPAVRVASFKSDTFTITKFGAIPDGYTLNTKALQSAIDACHKNGGGVVVIPAGLWLTGPIELKNNVNLHLLRSSLLQFTTDFSQYKLVEGNWEGLPQMRNQSPISASNATNIAITGFGIVDGGGEAWRMVKKEKLTESQWKQLVASGGVLSEDKKIWYPTEKSLKGSQLKNPGLIAPGKSMEEYNAVKDFLRPNLLVLTGCKQILLEGITFRNSAAWCLHPLMSEDIIIRNIKVENPWYAQNGDGLDLESCKNVIIEKSVFDVGDDGICIKSGRDEAGRKRAMPTENVKVSDCTVYQAHGGFVIGSEMSGGAKNIYVERCTFIGTDIGLRFKTARGRGGVVENIYITDIAMKDISGDAILFDMYYAAVDPVPLAGEERRPPKVETLPVTDETPQFRNFYIKNVVCNGAAKAIFVRGLPEMSVENIVLENMTLQAKEGIDMTEGSNIVMNNIRLITKNTNPVVNIHNSRQISFSNLSYPENAELLFNITGEKTSAVRTTKSNLTKAKRKTKFNFGAGESVFQEN